MATFEELKDALVDALATRGVLDQLKAQVRAEVFQTLDDDEEERPELTDDNLVINELIREYLVHNNLEHTLSVFLKETRQPDEPLGRPFLASEVTLQEKSRSRPLLYSALRRPGEDIVQNGGHENSSETGHRLEFTGTAHQGATSTAAVRTTQQRGHVAGQSGGRNSESMRSTLTAAKHHPHRHVIQINNP